MKLIVVSLLLMLCSCSSKVLVKKCLTVNESEYFVCDSEWNFK